MLHVRLEPLSLQDVYDIWDALEGSYRLSLSYEVSAVDIDTADPPEAFSLVKTAVAEYAQIVDEG